MFRLDGRTALVTGAGQGNAIGILEALAEAGASVVVNDLDAARAEDVAGRLGARAAPFDVTDHAAVAAAVAEVGPVDVLVNNAGLPPEGRQKPFLDQSPDEWRPYVEVNLYGVLNCAHATVPGMCERGWGRVVTISSGAGLVGTDIGMSMYATGKAAALGFTRALASEVARHGVTVNALALGIMENAAAFVPNIARAVPVGRAGTGLDVGAAVVWLAAEGSWVTGQTIAVDGGAVMVR
jgi:NAD(P)-dependent dehydrogenase (short-subunit alcohol dehydrogenase family)